jgi:uncharacterized protein (DUF2235 family)
VKRLAVFFDGTWNKPGDHTNVRRLYMMTAARGADGAPQERFYDQGVGTHWYDRITGGAFGAGLSRNVQQGYQWLIERYDPGDEIYLFGFSRGAFTARSLAGLMARCGLLRRDSPIGFQQVFDRYRKGDRVKPIYQLIREKDTGVSFDLEEHALLDYSCYHRDLVTLVGVWDTVGSIGLPFGKIPGLSRRTLNFHNTHLTTIVQHSYQALALDEYRKPYWAILWTVFQPDPPDPNPPSRPDDRFVEQRWFPGAHANVGGGYYSDLLPQRPLAWIQEKARSRGLAFREPVRVDDRDLAMMPTDSYAQFLMGIWKIITLGKRYVRWVRSKPVPRRVRQTGTRGWVRTVNERIDLSVFRHCQLNSAYRPLGLREWARREGVDLEALIRSPQSRPELSSPVTTPGIEPR